MDEWTEGWKKGWMNGWVGGWVDRSSESSFLTTSLEDWGDWGLEKEI